MVTMKVTGYNATPVKEPFDAGKYTMVKMGNSKKRVLTKNLAQPPKQQDPLPPLDEFLIN